MNRIFVLLVLVLAVLLLWRLWPAAEDTEPGRVVPASQPEAVTPSAARPDAAEVAGSPARRSEIAPHPDAAPGIAVLAGLVVRDGDGLPVAAAVVRCPYDADALAAECLAEQRTDAQGRFWFRFVRPVQPWLAVAAGTNHGALERRAPAGLVPGQTREITLRVAAGARIEGRVVGGDGRPVPAARVLGWLGTRSIVQVDGVFEPAPQREATAGADGRFVLEAMGEEFVLDAQAPGMAARVRIEGKQDGRALLSGVELVLGRAAVLDGRLLDADRQPVAGWPFGDMGSTSGPENRTALANVFKADPVHLRTTTRADGTFRITGVAGYAYTWEVQHPSHPMWRAAHAPDQGFLEVVLARGETITGQVFRADGSAAEGATVRLNDSPRREARCDRQGRFALSGAAPLRAESYLVIQDERSAIHCVQPIPAPARDLVVRLEPSLSIAGRVVDRAGAPVGFAHVAIEGSRRVDPGFSFGGIPTWEWAHHCAEVLSERDGGFRFDRLYAGRFAVRATDPSDGQTRAEAEVEAGFRGLELRLDPASGQGVVLRGKVRDARSGQPVAEFTVWPGIHDAQGNATATAHPVTAADGRFELKGLTPGTLSVEVQAPGYTVWRQAARPLAAGFHDLDVELSAPRQVSLRVLREEQPVMARVSVRVPGDSAPWMLESGPGMRTTSLDTDDHGAVELRGLPARVVTLLIRPTDSEATEEHDLDLRDQPAAPVTVRLTGKRPPEPVHLQVLILAHERGADLSAFQGEPKREWLQLLRERQDVWAPQVAVTVTVRAKAGAVLGSGTVAPVEGTGPDANGFRTYRATARDAQGNETTSSTQPAPLPSLNLPARREALVLEASAPEFTATPRDLPLSVFDGRAPDATLVVVLFLSR